MKIKIICVSDGDKHFSPIIDEYIKRIGNNIEIINIKPFKDSNISLVIKKETEKIIDKLNKIKGYKVALAIGGKQLDTFGFKDILIKNDEIIFIIGGPYGYDEDMILKYIDNKISLSNMTFPHGLAKSILLEQIYRSQTIINNKQYHY